MDESIKQTTIFVIGNDERLAYLLQRYTEQSGCAMISMPAAPAIEEVNIQRPTAIIFSSIDQLDDAHALVETLSSQETLILVCTSLADKARAQELGADTCLIHPLIYEEFRLAMSGSRASREH